MQQETTRLPLSRCMFITRTFMIHATNNAAPHEAKPSAAHTAGPGHQQPQTNARWLESPTHHVPEGVVWHLNVSIQRM